MATSVSWKGRKAPQQRVLEAAAHLAAMQEAERAEAGVSLLPLFIQCTTFPNGTVHTWVGLPSTANKV